MPAVVGVSFREPGKIQRLNVGSLRVREGDVVVAETQRGLEIGRVRTPPMEVPEAEVPQPARSVVRLATPEDQARDQENRSHERHALSICAAKLRRHALPMKLLRAEYTHDRSRVIIFFSAEGRVDFRELVKDLASALRTRIELHQVGARDEARLLGGFGRCGRGLCCHAWMSGFEPVSMKMAKDQDLALNPTKFSGQCGKLMCCLRYESDFYREARQGLPKVGATITTEAGPAKVVEINIPTGVVRVEYAETGARATLSAEEVRAALPEPCCAAEKRCPARGRRGSS